MCNNCIQIVINWYHCQKCDDFDLCTSCYTSQDHHHGMTTIGLDADNDTSSDSQNLHPRETKREAIERFERALVHSTKCHAADCRCPSRFSCQQPKKVCRHRQVCQKKLNGSCPLCKQLIELCYLHACSCTDVRCMVPSCQKMKQNWKQQKKLRIKQILETSASAPALSFSSHGPDSTYQTTPYASAAALAQQPAPNILKAVDEVGDCWRVILNFIGCGQGTGEDFV